MLKRYVATVRVEVEASALEARDFLLEMLASDITKHQPTVQSIGAGAAIVRKASVSRVRPARVRRKA